MLIPSSAAGPAAVVPEPTTTCQVTMSANVTVTATFNLKTYTITASAGTGGGHLSLGGGQRHSPGPTKPSPSPPIPATRFPCPGRRRIQWGGLHLHLHRGDCQPHHKRDLYGHPQLYPDHNQNGTGSGTVATNPTGTSFSRRHPGHLDRLSRMPIPSSAAGPAACSGTTTTCQVTMSSNVTVTATFNLKTYTITASAGTGGGHLSLRGGQCPVRVQSNLHHHPQSGYTSFGRVRSTEHPSGRSPPTPSPT